jgi:hypothetical protein
MSTEPRTPCPACQGRKGRIIRPEREWPPYEVWSPCGACLGTGTVEDGQAKRAVTLDPLANARAALARHAPTPWTTTRARWPK